MKLNEQETAEEQSIDQALKKEPVPEENRTEIEKAGLEEYVRPLKKDYRTFISFLNEHKVPYNIDSGVLLGLMREGKLLDHEKDIDLQMWADDEVHLLQLLPRAWEKGYTITIWLYKGLVYQYRFLREDLLPVHIMLFRRAGDWAWCPAGEGIGPPYPRQLTSRFYYYFVVARKKLRERLVATEVTRWPWKARRRTGTWLVPTRFFEKREQHPLFEGYIPGEWEAYLTYRYGNWRLPAVKWNIWIDDGALKLLRPEKMVDLSRYQSWGGGPVVKEARKTGRR